MMTQTDTEKLTNFKCWNYRGNSNFKRAVHNIEIMITALKNDSHLSLKMSKFKPPQVIMGSISRKFGVF